MRIIIKSFALAVVALGLLSTSLAARDMHKMQSKYNVARTAEQLTDILTKNGNTIFARIDHAANAHAIGEELKPAIVLIFGNPKIGTALMKINQEVGFDLPLRAMIWQAADDSTWIHITSPAILNQDYLLGGANGLIDKMNAKIREMVNEAAGKDG